MTDLTEQCKKGELPNDIYYVELLGGNTTTAYMYKLRSYKKIVYRVKSFKGYVTKNQMKAVLSKAPSYEEWKASEKYNKHLEEKIKIYERKEKQHTDDAIAYNKLEAENAQLKELLKECREILYAEEMIASNPKYIDKLRLLIKKINQALGEDKCQLR